MTTQNRIVNLKNAKGMWIKIDPRHKTIHFVQVGLGVTLCGIKTPEKLFVAEGDCRDCPTCEKKILELEPEIAIQIRMLDKEIGSL